MGGTEPSEASDATSDGAKGQDKGGNSGEHPDRESRWEAPEAGGGYRFVDRRQEEKAEAEEEVDARVTTVELGVVPQLMWQCPDCLTVHVSQDHRLIQPVGNFMQVAWKCDCGREGRLTRNRVQTTNREQRRREVAMKKKLRKQQ